MVVVVKTPAPVARRRSGSKPVCRSALWSVSARTVAARREDVGDQRLEGAGVGLVEGGGAVAVDVEHADQAAAAVADRHHDLRAGGGGAGDMAGKGVDVLHHLQQASARGRPADAAGEGDDEASMTIPW